MREYSDGSFIMDVPLPYTGNQTFDFPDGFILKPQQAVSLVSGKEAASGDGKLMWSTANFWNNENADTAELYDQTDKKVSEYN